MSEQIACDIVFTVDIYVLCVCFLFLLILGIIVLAGTFVLAVGSVIASSTLHSDLLGNCMRSPMEFYDITPVGRIVNRFGKDLDTVDNVIPMTFQSWCLTTFKVLSTLIIIAYSTPLFLVAGVPLGIFYYTMQVVITISNHEYTCFVTNSIISFIV